MFFSLHAFQLSQVLAITSGTCKLFKRSSGCSSTVQTKPADRCHAMWQWKGQMPGLSWFHCTTMYEFACTWATSRRVGLALLTTVPSQQVPNSERVSPARPSPMRRALSSPMRLRRSVFSAPLPPDGEWVAADELPWGGPPAAPGPPAPLGPPGPPATFRKIVLASRQGPSATIWMLWPR